MADRTQRLVATSSEDAEVALERLLEVTRSALERTSQLQGALESRIVIEQAKGILAERLDISLDEAFELIRSAARANRLRLRILATRVVGSRETPAEIAALLD
jgi:AmiR/NasT family two-component response regulator